MATYHLDSLQYHVLYIIVVLPIIISWFVAFYSYEKVKSYTESIRKTAEGDEFALITKGHAWLAWSLPLTLIISLMLNTIANSFSGFHVSAIIIANYISVLIPLIAFSYIGSGSRGLLSRAHVTLSLSGIRGTILIFAALGVLFCFATFQHINITSIKDSNNLYFMPVWLMVLTVIGPYLYAWFVGLLAAFELSAIGRTAKGVLYRQAMQLFSSGLIAVISSSIALQYVSSVIPRTGSLLINGRLLLSYLFRLVAVLGFILLAAGARKLQRIEEV